MFNLPGLPDLNKVQALFEEFATTFKQLTKEVAEIRETQNEILDLLDELKEEKK